MAFGFNLLVEFLVVLPDGQLRLQIERGVCQNVILNLLLFQSSGIFVPRHIRRAIAPLPASCMMPFVVIPFNAGCIVSAQAIGAYRAGRCMVLLAFCRLTFLVQLAIHSTAERGGHIVPWLLNLADAICQHLAGGFDMMVPAYVLAEYRQIFRR